MTDERKLTNTTEKRECASSLITFFLAAFLISQQQNVQIRSQYTYKNARLLSQSPTVQIHLISMLIKWLLISSEINLNKCFVLFVFVVQNGGSYDSVKTFNITKGRKANELSTKTDMTEGSFLFRLDLKYLSSKISSEFT